MSELHLGDNGSLWAGEEVALKEWGVSVEGVGRSPLEVSSARVSTTSLLTEPFLNTMETKERQGDIVPLRRSRSCVGVALASENCTVALVKSGCLSLYRRNLCRSVSSRVVSSLVSLFRGWGVIPWSAGSLIERISAIEADRVTSVTSASGLTGAFTDLNALPSMTLIQDTFYVSRSRSYFLTLDDRERRLVRAVLRGRVLFGAFSDVEFRALHLAVVRYWNFSVMTIVMARAELRRLDVQDSLTKVVQRLRFCRDVQSSEQAIRSITVVYPLFAQCGCSVRPLSEHLHSYWSGTDSASTSSSTDVFARYVSRILKLYCVYGDATITLGYGLVVGAKVFTVAHIFFDTIVYAAHYADDGSLCCTNLATPQVVRSDVDLVVFDYGHDVLHVLTPASFRWPLDGEVCRRLLLSSGPGLKVIDKSAPFTITHLASNVFAYDDDAALPGDSGAVIVALQDDCVVGFHSHGYADDSDICAFRAISSRFLFDNYLLAA